MTEITPVFSFRAGEAHTYYDLLVRCKLPLEKAKVLAEMIKGVIDSP